MSSVAWRERRLDELLSEHHLAVGDFVHRACAIPRSRWLVPRGDGKWSPAQETRHLILTYEGLLGDLNDERRPALRGTALRRRIWRIVGLTQILWRGRIPAAVPAPREFRPEPDETPRADLLALYERRGREFCGVFRDKWRLEPRRTVQHPYFGNLKLEHAMRLCTVHTRHHAAFLAHSMV